MSAAAAHYCSSTLIVVGDEVSLEEISEQLAATPDRTWSKGERKSFQRPDGTLLTFDSFNDQSGWKRFIPDGLRDSSLDEQLQFWEQFMVEREAALTRLTQLGMEVVLDLYVGSLESGLLPPSLLGLLGRCGISIEWTFAK